MSCLRKRHPLVPLLLVAASTALSTSCSGTNEVRRHGKVWRMSDDAEATYRAAVLEVATIQNRFGGHAGAACGRIKELEHRYKNWVDKGSSPADLLRIDREALCAVAGEQDRQREASLLAARQRTTTESPDEAKPASSGHRNVPATPAAADRSARPAPTSTQPETEQKGQDLSSTVPGADLKSNSPCAENPDCGIRGLCVDSIDGRCLATEASCKGSRECREGRRCAVAPDQFSCVESQSSPVPEPNRKACALGAKRLNLGPDFALKLAAVAQGDASQYAQVVALRTVGDGVDKLGYFEARRRLLNPAYTDEIAAKLVDVFRCMQGSVLFRAYMLEQAFFVATEDAIALMEMPALSAQEAAQLEAQQQAQKERETAGPSRRPVKAKGRKGPRRK